LDASLAKCGICGKLLYLLLQAYAPLEGTDYERVLYVFACREKSCQKKDGSVKAFRAVSVDTIVDRAAGDVAKLDLG